MDVFVPFLVVNFKIHTGFPSSSFLSTSISISPSSPSLHAPLLFLRSWSLFFHLRDLGKCCKLPEHGLRQSHSQNRFWCILALFSHLVGTVLIICLRISRSNFIPLPSYQVYGIMVDVLTVPWTSLTIKVIRCLVKVGRRRDGSWLTIVISTVHNLTFK